MQLVQDDAPDELYVPAVQAAHTDSPVDAAIYPGLHEVQDAEPADAANVPLAHEMQAAAPVDDEVPITQLVQEVEPVEVE